MGRPRNGRQRPADEVYGLLPHEAAILDRTDAGIDEATVAAEMGCALGTVIGIVAKYPFALEAQARTERMIRSGSCRLAAAIAATGGRFA